MNPRHKLQQTLGVYTLDPNGRRQVACIHRDENDVYVVELKR